MRKKYSRHTKEELEPIVASSRSYSQCLKQLGLRATGGNYKLIQRNIDKFGLDDSHMTHRVWNKGMEIIPFEGLTGKESIRKRLIKERNHKCESCNNTHWLGQEIMLELEHIDGDNRNNERYNLMLLCPNCHSHTPTWRNRKRI